MTPRSAARALLPLVLVGGGLLILAQFATASVGPRALTEDERDYLGAASNLIRYGVFSAAAPGAAPPKPDAFREPGYPVVLALSWRLSGTAPPTTVAELEEFARQSDQLRALAHFHVLLLLFGALASGAVAARLAGAVGGALAFFLVAASPALAASARLAASENLAAPLVAITTLALVRAVEGRTAAIVLAAVAAGALPLVRAAGSVVIFAGAAVLFVAHRGRSATPVRLRRAALFLALALAPTLLWQFRNLERIGRFVPTDRGGLALAVRAELDREVEQYGALAPALAFTPVDALQRESERRAPAARFNRPVWSGSGNFFSRVMAPWRAERASGRDSLSHDRRYRTEAFATFAAHPGAHLVTSLVVAWRALFVERSPDLATPFDLRLVIGLLFAASFVVVAVRCVRGRDARLAALLAPAAALFVFHALATEFLPRYALPLLPVAWATVTIAVVGGTKTGHGPRSVAPAAKLARAEA